MSPENPDAANTPMSTERRLSAVARGRRGSRCGRRIQHGLRGEGVAEVQTSIGSTTSPAPAARVVSSARTVNLFRPLATALTGARCSWVCSPRPGSLGSSTSRFGRVTLGWCSGTRPNAQSLVAGHLSSAGTGPRVRALSWRRVHSTRPPARQYQQLSVRRVMPLSCTCLLSRTRAGQWLSRLPFCWRLLGLVWLCFAFLVATRIHGSSIACQPSCGPPRIGTGTFSRSPFLDALGK